MNPPFLLKSYSLRTFFQSLLFSTLLSAIAACFYWLSQDMGAAPNPKDYISIVVFLIFFGLLQWMVQKNTLFKLLAKQPALPKTKAAAPQASEADRKIRRNKEKRLFVHLFSVLQREGRFMDFLQEDLTHYQDEQIGAAVRTIHENCKKTIGHYLSPEPIMKAAEGEIVEIAAGFDRHAVKLVGNVVGEPPFSGILRHRGWQLQSISLPKLSDKDDPSLIAPAEVEIQ